MATMKRNGKRIPILPDGHPRRMSDARNAWRRMDDAQRRAFLQWIAEETPEFLTTGAANPRKGDS